MTITPYQLRKLNRMGRTERLIKCHQLGIKRCSTCRKYLSRDLFYRNKASSDGLCGNCKECSRSASKAWHSDNHDYVCARRQANREIAQDALQERIRQRAVVIMGPTRADARRLKHNQRMRARYACAKENQ